MINCIVIDNDNKVEENLKKNNSNSTLFSFSRVDEDHKNSLNSILKNQPDIVFLNIDTEKIVLSELLLEINLCEISQPFFIALSKFKDKAFEAYKYGFSDFLLKPLSELSIRKSLLRFQKKYPSKEKQKICLKSYKDYQYLILDEILFLRADNNTTDFHMVDGRVIGAFKTLKTFEKILPNFFLRIHKSYIININKISRMNYGKSICFVKDEHKIPFTKTFQENVEIIKTSLTKNIRRIETS